MHLTGSGAVGLAITFVSMVASVTCALIALKNTRGRSRTSTDKDGPGARRRAVFGIAFALIAGGVGVWAWQHYNLGAWLAGHGTPGGTPGHRLVGQWRGGMASGEGFSEQLWTFNGDGTAYLEDHSESPEWTWKYSSDDLTLRRGGERLSFRVNMPTDREMEWTNERNSADVRTFRREK